MEFNQINEQSSLSNLTNVNGTLYFTSRNYTNGNEEELWRINSSGNAVLVKDINLGADLPQSYLTNVNGTLYFTASSSMVLHLVKLVISNQRSNAPSRS
jgi:ELWxxDGT repeat protein